MEQNKTGKYFKYAIGEIILVVIGILIALSINNWNVNRIDKIQENKYLNNIKLDLQKDLSSLTYQLNFRKENIKALKSLLPK